MTKSSPIRVTNWVMNKFSDKLGDRFSESYRVGSLSLSWILLAERKMVLASHWSIFLISILAISNNIEGQQHNDEQCRELKDLLTSHQLK